MMILIMNDIVIGTSNIVNRCYTVPSDTVKIHCTHLTLELNNADVLKKVNNLLNRFPSGICNDT